jgi:hypothetical protein
MKRSFLKFLPKTWSSNLSSNPATAVATGYSHPGDDGDAVANCPREKTKTCMHTTDRWTGRQAAGDDDANDL